MKTYLFLIYILFSVQTHANELLYKESFRRCLLLPLKTKGSIKDSSSVYVALEQHINKLNFCELIKDKELFQIFQEYNHNLDFYLENPEILKTLSNKSRSGSLIKVSILEDLQNSLILKLNIIASNGNEYLFERRKVLAFKNNDLIIAQLKSWIGEYANQVPYHSRVIEKVKDLFLIEKSHFIFKGEEYFAEIIRPRKIKDGKNTSFKTTSIGRAIITINSDGNTTGKLSSYDSELKIQKGDWIVINSITKSKYRRDKLKLPSVIKAYEMNQVGIGMIIGTGDIGISNPIDADDEMGGLIYGIDLTLQYWMGKTFSFEGQYSKVLGSYGIKERSTHNEFYGEPNKLSKGLNIKLPRIPYLERVSMTLKLNRQSATYFHETTEKFTAFKLKSNNFGFNAKFTITRNNFLSLQYMNSFSAKYQEITQLYGEAEAASNQIYRVSLFYLPLGTTRYHSFYLSVDTKKAEFNSASYVMTATESLMGYNLYFNF